MTVTDDPRSPGSVEPAGLDVLAAGTGPSGPPATASTRPPPPPHRPNRARRALRTPLLMVAALAAAIVLQAGCVSGWQHQSAQARAFAAFRGRLAQGTAPVGQTDQARRLLPLGTPVALLSIPAARVHEVVGEGTTSSVLMDGPGHRRDTPLPGQQGTSVIFGRRAAYGGPFKRLTRLQRGNTITVTTGQGVSTYKVMAVRHGGDLAPEPPAARHGRLTLVTADGALFTPSGVIRVDADLVSSAFDAPRPVSGLPKTEQALADDASTTWALVLWLEALIALAVIAVWSSVRWGRVQTWVVFLPLTLVAGLAATGQFMRLLPNLL